MAKEFNSLFGIEWHTIDDHPASRIDSSPNLDAIDFKSSEKSDQLVNGSVKLYPVDPLVNICGASPMIDLDIKVTVACDVFKIARIVVVHHDAGKVAIDSSLV
jgi:hypothetical protein